MISSDHFNIGYLNVPQMQQNHLTKSISRFDSFIITVGFLMVKCPICGSNTPQGRFCEHCGAQLVALQQPAYPPYIPPVSNVPTSFPESKSTERSFYYSGIFYIVFSLDIVLSFFTGLGGILGFFIETSKPFPDPFGFVLAIFLMIVFLINLGIDLVLLNHMRKFPNSIDSTTCWMKSLFGFLGIVTFISGLYFLIISIKMQGTYDARQR